MKTYYYCRVSTSDQSVDNQIATIRARYTDADKVFCDEGVSGTKITTTRPAFSEMLTVIQPGDTVIITALDRIGRNTVDVITTVNNLTKAGISLISLREGVDFSTATGRLVLGVLASVAEMERESISERTKQGLKAAKARGAVLGKPVSEASQNALALISQGFDCSHVMNETGISKAQYYKLKKTL